MRCNFFPVCHSLCWHTAGEEKYHAQSAVNKWNCLRWMTVRSWEREMKNETGSHIIENCISPSSLSRPRIISQIVNRVKSKCCLNNFLQPAGSLQDSNVCVPSNLLLFSSAADNDASLLLKINWNTWNATKSQNDCYVWHPHRRRRRLAVVSWKSF